MQEKDLKLLNVEVGKVFAQPQYQVTYSISEDGQETVILPPGIPTRSEVINAIISRTYPRDKMEAVINNYLLDGENEEYISEFNEMQLFRKLAKDFADRFLESINKF